MPASRSRRSASRPRGGGGHGGRWPGSSCPHPVAGDQPVCPEQDAFSTVSGAPSHLHFPVVEIAGAGAVLAVLAAFSEAAVEVGDVRRGQGLVIGLAPGPAAIASRPPLILIEHNQAARPSVAAGRRAEHYFGLHPHLVKVVNS